MKQNIVHAAPLKQSVQNLRPDEVRGKTVLVRADLNVPLSENLQVTDDTRLREAVPTVKLLLSHGARVLLASHLVGVVASSTLQTGFALHASVMVSLGWQVA